MMSVVSAAPKAVQQALVNGDFITASCQWQPLSGGRTNRVWQISGPDGSPDSSMVCKLFNQARDNPLYPNLPGAEYEALKALFQYNIAPEPVALLNTDVGEVLIYRHLEGTGWQTGTADVARLLARLHKSRLDLPLREIKSGSAALVRQTHWILAQCRTTLPVIAPRDPKVPPIFSPAVIHTDVVTSNIIVTSQGLRLIDWQCPGLGDPCEDLASFLSPAMQYLYGSGPLNPNQIAGFLAAYSDKTLVARYHKLAPLFHWRSAAYCLWKTQKGDGEYHAAMQLELSALQ